MQLNDFNNIHKTINESAKGSGFQDPEKSGNPPVTEGEERSIIADACIEKLVDTFGESPGLFADNQEELIQKMYSDLEAMDVKDVVDPTMEVGGQPIGNFASGRVLDVISANDVIEDALQHVNLADLEEQVSETDDEVDTGPTWKDDLEDALDGYPEWAHEYIKDGVCPECGGNGYMDGDYENEDGEENDECNGMYEYDCDEGEIRDNTWADELKSKEPQAPKQPAPSKEQIMKILPRLHDEYVKSGRFNAFELGSILKQMYPELNKREAGSYVGEFLSTYKEGMEEAESPYTNSNHSQNKIKKPFGADAHTKPEGGNPQVCDCITSSGAVPNCPKCGGTGQTTSPKRNDPQGILPETEVDEMYDKDDFDNVFGNRQYKKEFEYLDDLQASGVTNMFGGARYLVQDLGLDKAKADKVLQMWMRSKDQKEDFQEDEVDNDSNEAAVAKMIAKALGDENRWTDMTAHELYAELESTDNELAKVIQLTAKMLYDVKLTEAKNCGCGQDPCKTYGKIKESDDNSHEITLEDNQDFNDEFGVLGYSECDEDVFEAEYQGRKVKLNKPMQGDVKKFKVYVKDPKTKNVKKVNFGHGGSSVKGKSMRIRKSNPKARKSFRARHNCANPGPKTKARYWSCRKW